MKTANTEDDLGYFKKHPAPMWEAMCRLNPTTAINSTTPHYGPLLYAVARAMGAHNILEIGVAEGYSSGFLAWGLKENNTRYAANGRYFGLDTGDKGHVEKAHQEEGLPSVFIKHERGSVDFLEHQRIWTPNFFDLVFIDGWHNVEYVKREMELLYPLVKGNGCGYIAHHDIYAFCEKLWPWMVQQQAPDINGVMRAKYEHIRFLDNYGFGLLRKMEGYDHSKVFWPDGDQPPGIGFDPKAAGVAA